MFMPKQLAWLLCLVVTTVNAENLVPKLGKLAPKELIDRWNYDVFPDGEGLPKGQGNVEQGRAVYQQYCQICHGAEGQGGNADELAGARHGLTDNPPDKTIGTYWPYATTIFDFTRRAMPLDRPGILNNDQVYAVTAYLLYLNHLVKPDAVISAQNLAKIEMPNKAGFINVYESAK